MTTHSTTPFGRRSALLGLTATQIEANALAAKPGTTQEFVHKRRGPRPSRKSDASLGLSDRGSHNTACPPNVSLRDAEEAAKKFSRPHTCSRRAAPTVEVALTAGGR
jgi:hypothetical protein